MSIIDKLITVAPTRESFYQDEANKQLTARWFLWFEKLYQFLRDPVFKTAKIGTDAGYTEVESDGTLVAHGSATTWEDMNGSALQLKVSGVGLSINSAENQLEFTTGANLSDYAYDNYQLRHAWKLGSVLKPHIHWHQAQNQSPNWLLQYRWQANAEAKTTAWTNLKCNTLAFTYTSGTLNQISYSAALTPPANAGLSDILEVRLLRDNSNTSGVFSGADTYTATAAVMFVDIHIEEDTLGSRTEYVK